MSTLVPASVLRHRPEGEHVEVGPIELFFDLVYVFTIVQLSHTLLEHLTWGGALRTAVLFLAVWWAWNLSAWAMNWLDPDSAAVRLLLVALMLCAFWMAVALPHAFDTDAWLFVVPYVLLQAGRSVFMVVAFRGRDDVMARNFGQLLAWTTAAAVLWIVGAALPEWRLVAWVLAVALDYLGPVMDFWLPGRGRTPMADWSLRAEHLAERNELVFIIALGETVLLLGGVLGDVEVSTPTVVAIAIGTVTLVSLWWNYFNRFADPEHVDTAGGRSAFAYANGLMVCGAIVVAVAIELLVVHPTGHIDRPTVLVVFGGPLLYLVGNLWFHHATDGIVPAVRTWSTVVLAGVGALVWLAVDQVAPLVAFAMPAAALGVIAVATELQRRAADRQAV